MTKVVHGVVEDLIKVFNTQFSGYAYASSYRPLDYRSVGFTYWIRGDGKKFKSLGEIYPYSYEVRNRYEFDWTLFAYVPKFWKWLQSLSGAELVGKVSDWTEFGKLKDGVLYKGIVFICSDEENSIIEFGSKSEFNDSSLWRIERLNKTPNASSL